MGGKDERRKEGKVKEGVGGTKERREDVMEEGTKERKYGGGRDEGKKEEVK